MSVNFKKKKIIVGIKNVASNDAKNSGKISLLQKIPMQKLITYSNSNKIIPTIAAVRCFLVYI